MNLALPALSSTSSLPVLSAAPSLSHAQLPASLSQRQDLGTKAPSRGLEVNIEAPLRQDGVGRTRGGVPHHLLTPLARERMEAGNPDVDGNSENPSHGSFSQSTSPKIKIKKGSFVSRAIYEDYSDKPDSENESLLEVKIPGVMGSAVVASLHSSSQSLQPASGSTTVGPAQPSAVSLGVQTFSNRYIQRADALLRSSRTGYVPSACNCCLGAKKEQVLVIPRQIGEVAPRVCKNCRQTLAAGQEHASCCLGTTDCNCLRCDGGGTTASSLPTNQYVQLQLQYSADQCICASQPMIFTHHRHLFSLSDEDTSASDSKPTKSDAHLPKRTPCIQYYPAKMLRQLPPALDWIAPHLTRLKFRTSTFITCPALISLASDPMAFLNALYRDTQGQRRFLQSLCGDEAPSAEKDSNGELQPMSEVSLSTLATTVRLSKAGSAVFPYVDPISLLLLHSQWRVSNQVHDGDFSVFRRSDAGHNEREDNENTTFSDFSSSTSNVIQGHFGSWFILFGRPGHTVLRSLLRESKLVWPAEAALDIGAKMRQAKGSRALMGLLGRSEDEEDLESEEEESAEEAGVAAVSEEIAATEQHVGAREESSGLASAHQVKPLENEALVTVHRDDMLSHSMSASAKSSSSFSLSTSFHASLTPEMTNTSLTSFTARVPPCNAEVYCCCPPALANTIGAAIDSVESAREMVRGDQEEAQMRVWSERKWRAVLYKENF